MVEFAAKAIEPDGGPRTCYGRLIIEAKVRPVPVGDILRQLTLYRSYVALSGIDVWGVAATAFDLTEGDVATLRAKRILHVRLGVQFDTYCTERSHDPQQSQSLEI
jgi:hypothetical protein